MFMYNAAFFVFGLVLYIYLYFFSFFLIFFDLHTLGIWNSTQPNGLAVPDASMHSVKSTGDVLELMKIGLMNRAVGATALNERSSRSHRFLFRIVIMLNFLLFKWSSSWARSSLNHFDAVSSPFMFVEWI